jgi:hypothetical protein
MHIARTQNLRDVANKMVDLGDAFTAGRAAEPGMSAAQSREFVYFAFSTIQDIHEQFLERKEGMIDAQRWNGSRLVLRSLLSWPGWRAVYKLQVDRLDKDFVTLADTLIAEVKKEPTPSDIVTVWQMLAASEREAATATI